MTRAQPDQPRGRPNPGIDQPFAYPADPADAGAPGYRAPGNPGPLTGDTSTAPIATAAPAGGAAPASGVAPTTSVSRPRHSRTGAAWVAVVIAAIVLIFFLIFILQNSEPVEVQYLGWQGTLSLGVAMMFAALAGALTVGLLGTVRILQLRARAKRAGG